MANIITTNGRGTYQIITWFGAKVKVKYKVYDGKVYVRPLELYTIEDCLTVITLLKWFQSTIKAEVLHKKIIIYTFDHYG